MPYPYALPEGIAATEDGINPRTSAQQWRIVLIRGRRISELGADILADVNTMIEKQNFVTTTKDMRSETYEILKRYGEVL